MAASEALGLTARVATRHPDDLTIAETQHLVALMTAAVSTHPLG